MMIDKLESKSKRGLGSTSISKQEIPLFPKFMQVWYIALETPW